jgi:hypothetical protein
MELVIRAVPTGHAGSSARASAGTMARSQMIVFTTTMTITRV